MKRKGTLITTLTLAALFAFTQMAIAIMIPNHFVSTSSESNMITINQDWGGLTGDWYFGVYDFNGNPSSGLDLFQGSYTSIYSANFAITYENNHYQIEVMSGVFNGSILDIGDSNDFSFYFRNDSTYDMNFLITGVGVSNYVFSNMGGGNVIGTDLSVVSTPIPGSVILLFSGFTALMAFNKRRRIKELSQ